MPKDVRHRTVMVPHTRMETRERGRMTALEGALIDELRNGDRADSGA
jgi:hypothetical protein